MATKKIEHEIKFSNSVSVDMGSSVALTTVGIKGKASAGISNSLNSGLSSKTAITLFSFSCSPVKSSNIGVTNSAYQDSELVSCVKYDVSSTVNASYSSAKAILISNNIKEANTAIISEYTSMKGISHHTAQVSTGPTGDYFKVDKYSLKDIVEKLPANTAVKYSTKLDPDVIQNVSFANKNAKIEILSENGSNLYQVKNSAAKLTVNFADKNSILFTNKAQNYKVTIENNKINLKTEKVEIAVSDKQIDFKVDGNANFLKITDGNLKLLKMDCAPSDIKIYDMNVQPGRISFGGGIDVLAALVRLKNIK